MFKVFLMAMALGGSAPASVRPPQPTRLYAPCPLMPQVFPKWEERKT